MVKKVSLLCFVVVLAASLSGCLDEEECKEEFGLSKCTQKDCTDKYGPGPIIAPDGPDIDLGPGAGNELIWKINDVSATDGGTVLDQSNSATYCKLREDFIGKEVLKFKYTPEGQTTKRRAGAIHLVSGEIELEITATSSSTLSWWIKNTTTGDSCTLTKVAVPATLTDVPTEFLGLTYAQSGDEFKEVYDNKDAEALEFKAKY